MSDFDGISMMNCPYCEERQFVDVDDEKDERYGLWIKCLSCGGCWVLKKIKPAVNRVLPSE